MNFLRHFISKRKLKLILNYKHSKTLSFGFALLLNNENLFFLETGSRNFLFPYKKAFVTL